MKDNRTMRAQGKGLLELSDLDRATAAMQCMTRHLDEDSDLKNARLLVPDKSGNACNVYMSLLYTNAFVFYSCHATRA